MKATIRQQVKENFQSMEFSKAMEVNNELKSEYIRVCGQRSWVSLVNYYSKKAAKEQPEAEQQPEETAVEQPEVQEPVAEVKELSPIMKQFHDLKEQHPDAVLLFRVGDFYETYGEDAETASQILGIVLTTRNTDGTKMAGFPHHALDTYLPKLVRAGKRIAICEMARKIYAYEDYIICICAHVQRGRNARHVLMHGTEMDDWVNAATIGIDKRNDRIKELEGKLNGKTIDERIKEIMATKEQYGEFSLDLYYDNYGGENEGYVAKVHSAIDSNMTFHGRAASFHAALDMAESFIKTYKA